MAAPVRGSVIAQARCGAQGDFSGPLGVVLEEDAPEHFDVAHSAEDVFIGPRTFQVGPHTGGLVISIGEVAS